MPSKSKRLTEAEIEVFEAKRDIGEELLESIRDMKAGKGQVVVSPAIEARSRTGLSQSQFATLLGVSVRNEAGRTSSATNSGNANLLVASTVCMQQAEYAAVFDPEPHLPTPKPGMRCGVGEPLCAAEERSFSRIRAARCLSAASLRGPREKRAPEGSPKGRRTGVARAVPHTGRASMGHENFKLNQPVPPVPPA